MSRFHLSPANVLALVFVQLVTSLAAAQPEAPPAPSPDAVGPAATPVATPAQPPDAPAASEAPAQTEAGRAQADADARAYFVAGDEFYASGRYEEAERAFAEAYRLSPRPLLLFNLANAQERSGRWERAVTSLRAYREHAPSSEYPALDTRIAELQRRIDARAAEARDEPVVVIQHDRVNMQERSSATAPRQPFRPHRLLLPVAGALLATTVGLALATRSARDDVRAQCPSVGGARWCPPTASGALDRDRRLSISTDVTGLLALGAAGVGLWLLVRHRREAAEADSTAPLFEVGGVRGGGMLRLRGGF